MGVGRVGRRAAATLIFRRVLVLLDDSCDLRPRQLDLGSIADLDDVTPPLAARDKLALNAAAAGKFENVAPCRDYGNTC